MTGRTCEIEGCNRPHNAKGLCNNHGQQARLRESKQTPTLRADGIDLTGQQFGRLTVVHHDPGHPGRGTHWYCTCICGNTVTVRSEKLRTGRTRSCGCLRHERSGRRTDTPTYRTIHTRLAKQRGRADAHPCIDCGQRARDWSLRNDAMDVLVGPTKPGGPVCSYSTDLNDYEPRCKTCHKRYDNAARLTP